MKIESTTALAVSLNTQPTEISQAGEPQSRVAATPTGFAESSRFEAGTAGIWAGPDGGGCIPSPFPRRLPPEPIPFPRPIPFPLPFPGKVTLSQEDRETAGGLKDALSNKFNQWIGKHDPDAHRVTLPRDPSGRVVGPEGQPLAQVKLDDGRTAYVDPNTNQYYLANKGGPLGGLGFGGVSATGPIDLPPEAQFSNSHFSEADVRAVERLSNRPVEPGVTLKQADRKAARGWSDSLSGNGRLLDSPKTPNAQLTRGQDGIMRGPEGEPLVQVKLRDGNTAYVDPNTNQYYLQGQRFGCFGSNTVTKGPFSLPPGAQVSNSHFSDADVRALQREANPPRIVWPPVLY